MFYFIALILALLSLKSVDVRFALAAALVAGIGWLYETMRDNGPPE